MSLLAVRSRLGVWVRSETAYKVASIVAAVGAGLVFGAIVVYSGQLPSEWTSIVILATMAPTFALIIGNMHKLLLIIMVLDIPLGLDISLADRAGHRGGPGGFLVSLMTIALVVGYARWPLKRPAKTMFHDQKDIAIPALAFLFITLVSAFQAVDVWFTVTQLFLTLQFVLMFFYLINHVDSWNDVRLIVTTLTICLLLESILMIGQFYGGLRLSLGSIDTYAAGSEVASATPRVGGTLGGPNPAATFLSTSLAITFAAFLTDNRLVNKWLAFAAVLLGIGALVMTQSRAGWLVTALTLPAIAAQALRKRISRKLILLLLGVTLILGLGFAGLVLERFTADDRNSAESRLWYSELALNFIREHVFTGIGANNQRFVVDDDAYAPPEMVGRERTTIHNTYLAIWVELGLFGLAAFAWLLMAGGRRVLSALRRTADRYASVVISGLLGALTVNALHMAVASFTHRRMQFLWLILALISVVGRLASQTQELEEPVSRTDPGGILRSALSLDTPGLDSSGQCGGG